MASVAPSIPPGPERDPIVAVTCAIVVRSILVRGLAIGRVVGATSREEATPATGATGQSA